MYSDKLKGKICFNTYKCIAIIDPQKIVYFTRENRLTKVVLDNDKEYIINYTLKHIEEKIIKKNFIRTHKSYLVNIEFIVEFETKAKLLILKNGVKVPISRQKYSDFLNILNL